MYVHGINNKNCRENSYHVVFVGHGPSPALLDLVAGCRDNFDDLSQLARLSVRDVIVIPLLK